jgi:hypothetical protein
MFSKKDLTRLIVPLIFEQILSSMIGIVASLQPFRVMLSALQLSL